MKTMTVLQFTDLADLCRYLKVIQASAYYIDTSKLTVKAQLSAFETAVAVEQFKAALTAQYEKVG